MLHNPHLISQRHLSLFHIALAVEAWLIMSISCDFANSQGSAFSLLIQSAMLLFAMTVLVFFCWPLSLSFVIVFIPSSSLFLFACPLHCLCLLWANEELESSSCHSSRPFISKLSIWLICCASGHQSDIDVNQKQYLKLLYYYFMILIKSVKRILFVIWFFVI